MVAGCSVLTGSAVIDAVGVCRLFAAYFLRSHAPNGLCLENKSFDLSLQFVYRKWFDYIVVASRIDAALKLKSTV
jgi:hypothetical protein